MRLKLDNCWARAPDATAAELEFLHEYLCFEDNSRAFLARKFGWSDGTARLFNKRTRAFPAGLVGMVVKAARAEGLEVVIRDDRKPAATAACNPTVNPTLRDYQAAAVKRVVERARGIVQLPTGSGKTRIAFGLTEVLPLHWLFIVPRKDLLRQTVDAYRGVTGREAGVLGSGRWEPDPARRLTVATFQTLTSKMRSDSKLARGLLADAEGLIADEAHTLAAGKWWRVAMATRRAYYRVGLSATPLVRGDRRSINTVAALGPVIYRLRADALIERGVLAKPIIRVVALAQRCNASNWQRAVRQLIAESAERDALVVEMALAAARPMLVFVKQIEHGRRLTRLLRSVGLSVEFQWGAKASEERAAAIQRLRFGDTDAIVCSVIFQEGVDIPELAAVVNAAGMRSAIAAIQRIGRGMRSDDGRKRTFEVWDVKDEGCGFTARHASSRLRAYRSEGYEVQVVDGKTLRPHKG